MLRRNPKQVGRALGDWLRRHRGERPTTIDPTLRVTTTDRSPATAARAERLRRLASVRVTPYQLRRGLLW